MILEISEYFWNQLSEVMAQESERVAFLFSTKKEHDIWTVSGLRVVGKAQLVGATDNHVELADEVLPEVIQYAHSDKSAVTEVHNHPFSGPDTAFSGYDLLGLEDLAPHMLWRLPERPYTAIVIGQDSIDGLTWNPDLSPLQSVVVGSHSIFPTGISYKHLRQGMEHDKRVH
jgi:hypothetical protein